MPSGICGIIEESILHFAGGNYSAFVLNVAQRVSPLVCAEPGPTVMWPAVQ